MVKTILALYVFAGTVTETPANCSIKLISAKVTLLFSPKTPVKLNVKSVVSDVWDIGIYVFPPLIAEVQKRQTPFIVVVPPVLLAERVRELFQGLGV